MDIIKINNLHIETIIGCNPEERKKKQPLFITISIAIDTYNAAATDDLKNTLNYDCLAQQIKKMAEQSNFFLIETMAQQVANIALQDKRVMQVTVELVKPNALKDADSAEIIITRSRNNE